MGMEREEEAMQSTTLPEPVAMPPAEAAAAIVEPKLSEKQRERIQRLMAAVKAELTQIIGEDKDGPVSADEEV